MEESDSSKFLENIIDKESEIYEKIFLNKYLSCPKNKRQTQKSVFNIISCKQILTPDYKPSEKDNTWYLCEGLGYGIYELRRKGISDKEIHKRIVESRDEFLEFKGIKERTYEKVLEKKQCLETYKSVRQSLGNFLKEIN
jgi:hypothetical protein